MIDGAIRTSREGKESRCILMDQGTDAQVRHPGMGGGNSRGMLESYLTWRHGWPKRQTVKSRCQESLSKVEGRGSQIPGRPGTSIQ